VLDGEPDAEIYCAATTKEQAGIAFRDALIMRDESPALRSRVAKMGNSVKPHLANLSVASTNSLFRPLSAEHRGLDGKRPHIVIIDEEHEHPSNLVVEKMRAGTKGRRQALIFRITNSGYDRETVCWYDHDYTRQILEGALENESWFGFVCALDCCEACRLKGREQPSCDNCDNWLDEDVWIKANPGLGTILPKKYLQEQVQEALAMPAKENLVRRLNFCQWTQSEERAISPDSWKQCSWAPDDPTAGDPIAWRERMLKLTAGKKCFSGLDLGVVNDFCCLANFFPQQDGLDHAILIPYFWVPENAEQHKLLKERVPYDLWIKNGFLHTTPGEVTDYRFILKQILDLRATCSIEEIAYDRMYATMLVQMLTDEGLTMVEHGQGVVSMSHPIKEFYRLISGRGFYHGMNPVLAWMIDNLVVKSDPNGNLRCVKPENPSSPRKIDGAVASIMAAGRAAAHPDLNANDEVFFV
jgi:phage terminase large subunit-like protein